MKIKNSRANFTVFLSGVCLIVLAIILLIKPFEQTLMNFRFIGVVFILSGLLNILAFAQNKRWYFRPGWTLQQSFFLLFFGLLLFFSSNIEFDTDIMLFSFMAFFTAATQLACCIQLHTLEIKRWWWIAGFGLINLIFGVYFLTNPFAEYIDMFISIAVFVCITGMIGILEPLVYIKSKRKEGRSN